MTMACLSRYTRYVAAEQRAEGGISGALPRSALCAGLTSGCTASASASATRTAKSGSPRSA